MHRIAIALLGLVVVVEGAYLAKLGRAVGRLDSTVAAPSLAADEHALSTTDSRRVAPTAPSRAFVPVAGVAPPTFAAAAPSPGAAPVFEVLSSPEGRQRLQELLGSLKEQKRTDKYLQSADRRERLDQRLKEVVGPQLGLTADETRKVQDAITRMSDTRRHGVEEIRSGLRTRQDVKKDVDAVARASEDAIKEVLGDKRMLLLRELRKKEERALVAAAP